MWGAARAGVGGVGVGGAGVGGAGVAGVGVGGAGGGREGPGGPRGDLVHHSQKGAFSLRRGRWKVIFGTAGSGGWPPPADGFPDPVVFDPAFPDPALLERARAGDGAAPTGQLYDLEADPGETVNLFEERFDVVLELARVLDGYRRGGRSVPKRGP